MTDLTYSEAKTLIKEIGRFEFNGEHYGLDVVETDDGKEYAVAYSEKEVKDAVTSYIEDSLCYFDADFLASYIGSLNAYHIRKIQETLYEDCNDMLLTLVGDRFDELVDDAISSDGAGHFLAPYDNDELEVGDMYLYRIN